MCVLVTHKGRCTIDTTPPRCSVVHKVHVQCISNVNFDPQLRSTTRFFLNKVHTRMDSNSESHYSSDEGAAFGYQEEGRKRMRGMWVCPIFSYRRLQGEYHNLLQEMRLTDPDSHFSYLHTCMSKERFNLLL